MTLVEKALKKGTEHANAGEFEEAVAVYDQALKKNSSNHELIYAQAKAYFKLKNFDKALANFDLLIEKFPHQADLISERAVLFHHLGNNEKALVELNKAADLEPNNPFRYSSRAWIKAALKDTEGAIADYDKAIELDPEDSISYNNKGLLEDQMGYKKAATKSFDKSNALTGYKPEFNSNDDQNITDHNQPEGEDRVLEEKRTESTKITTSEYTKTLKGIFTSKEERKEFFSFIKNLRK